MNFTDRGIEELASRRGEEEVSLALAERLQTFGDLHPEFETPVDRLATHRASPGTTTTDDVLTERLHP